jgi:hypothetical protein
MADVRRQITQLARVPYPVLFEGGTGTGKTLAARVLHALSTRRDQPFVECRVSNLAHELAVDALRGHRRGAFTGAVGDRRGVFELAHGGTLFLDEVGTATPDVQLALLDLVERRIVTRLGDERAFPVDVLNQRDPWGLFDYKPPKPRAPIKPDGNRGRPDLPDDPFGPGGGWDWEGGPGAGGPPAPPADTCPKIVRIAIDLIIGKEEVYFVGLAADGVLGFGVTGGVGFFLGPDGVGVYRRKGLSVGLDGSVALEVGQSTSLPAFEGTTYEIQGGAGPLAVSFGANPFGHSASLAFGASPTPVTGRLGASHTSTKHLCGG